MISPYLAQLRQALWLTTLIPHGLEKRGEGCNSNSCRNAHTYRVVKHICQGASEGPVHCQPGIRESHVLECLTLGHKDIWSPWLLLNGLANAGRKVGWVHKDSLFGEGRWTNWLDQCLQCEHENLSSFNSRHLPKKLRVVTSLQSQCWESRDRQVFGALWPASQS